MIELKMDDSLAAKEIYPTLLQTQSQVNVRYFRPSLPRKVAPVV